MMASGCRDPAPMQAIKNESAVMPSCASFVMCARTRHKNISFSHQIIEFFTLAITRPVYLGFFFHLLGLNLVTS